MKRGSTVLRLKTANTVLYCHKWQQTVAFYRDTLQLPITFNNDWFYEFALTPTACVSIANASRATIEAVEGQGITLAWQVESIAAQRAWLLSKGVPVGPIHSRFGSAVCYFYDPEGHRLELWEPVSESN